MNTVMSVQHYVQHLHDTSTVKIEIPNEVATPMPGAVGTVERTNNYYKNI